MAEGDLVLNVARRHQAAVLEVSGDLDITTSSALTERLLGLVHDGERRVVIDLEGVRFIDSSGLAALVLGRNEAHQQGTTLALVTTNSGTRKLLTISQLDEVLPLFTSVDEAAE
jgi:anti-sigma B factor antagonist